MGYLQLTQGQRYQIEAFVRIGKKQAEIAREIGVHRSTISRELRRNCPLTEYRATRAIGLARRRHREKDKRQVSRETFDTVDELLKEYWSPEQISGRLKLEGKTSVSHETIYLYVYRDKHKGGELYKYLRRRHRYRKRIHKYHKRGFLEARRPISERPAVVDERSRFGDWEADTIVGLGQRSAMVSLVERKSLYCLLKKLPNKSAQALADAVCQTMQPIEHLVTTMTSDNGTEFALHKVIAETLGADFFFADPYSSWQRGTNENTNGLIRQYFPKKTDFSLVSDDLVEQVNYRLNNRPRKTLGYRTPAEVLFNQNVALIA
jgi:IS30 family transposase